MTSKTPDQNADRVQDLRDQRDRETDTARRSEFDQQIRDAEAAGQGQQQSGTAQQ